MSLFGGGNSGGGLFGNNGGNSGGGLFGNNGGNSGGGLFGNNGGNSGANKPTTTGGLFSGGTSSNTSGGLFSGSNTNNTNNQQSGNYIQSLTPTDLFTGFGFDQTDEQLIRSGTYFGQESKSAVNQRRFMQSYNMLSQGYNPNTIYGGLTGNMFANGMEQEGPISIDKEYKLKQFDFMTKGPINWRFKLTDNNPYQRKKISELPDNLKKEIVELDQRISQNKSILSKLKLQSKEMKSITSEKIPEQMEDSVRMLKVINIKLAKTMNRLRQVASEMCYYQGIVEQFKFYIESVRANRIPVYNIPSRNLITVSGMLRERLDEAKAQVSEIITLVEERRGEKTSAPLDNDLR